MTLEYILVHTLIMARDSWVRDSADCVCTTLDQVLKRLSHEQDKVNSAKLPWRPLPVGAQKGHLAPKV